MHRTLSRRALAPALASLAVTTVVIAFRPAAARADEQERCASSRMIVIGHRGASGYRP